MSEPAVPCTLLNGESVRAGPSRPAYVFPLMLGRIFDSAPLEIVWVPVVTDIYCAA